MILKITLLLYLSIEWKEKRKRRDIAIHEKKWIIKKKKEIVYTIYIHDV